MRKTLLLMLVMGAVELSTYAGGLLTNTNQSVQFVRMLSRNASTQIDAVYFNPAGLTMMEDGWHFSLQNQTILQDKTVDSQFPLLNNGKYVGEVKALIFPSAFAVYKKDKYALSFGFGPNGGGGSATFDKGLPSFEIPISKVVPTLSGLSALGYNVSNYDAKLYFDGSSVFYGLQAGLTYELADNFSVYGGVRILPSKNTYSGSIENISVRVNGDFINAGQFMTMAGNTLKGLAVPLQGAATQLQPVIDGGAGNYNLATLVAAGQMSQAQADQIKGGLIQVGMQPAAVDAMSVAQIQGAYSGYAAGFTAQGNQLIGGAGQLGDKQVETEQTGIGFTPIFGFNFAPTDNLNIGVKYEYKTALKLKNSTKVDDLGLFPDGQSSKSDIPSILAVGVGYKPSKFIETQLSYNLYFDKGVDWGKNVREIVYDRDVQRGIDNNYWELALGLQFNFSDKFSASIGGLTSNSGIADSYQSDFSYSNSSVTGAFGIEWRITDQLTFDAGVLNTFYKDATVSFNDPDLNTSYNEVLGKTTLDFGFGLTYSIFR